MTRSVSASISLSLCQAKRRLPLAPNRKCRRVAAAEKREIGEAAPLRHLDVASFGEEWRFGRIPPRFACMLVNTSSEREPAKRIQSSRMRAMGLHGVIIGKPVRTTVSDKAEPCPLDRVNRQFEAPAPNRLWVSDARRRQVGLTPFAPAGAANGSVKRSRVAAVDFPQCPSLKGVLEFIALAKCPVTDNGRPSWKGTKPFGDAIPGGTALRAG